MQQKLFIPVIVGTARKNAISSRVGAFVHSFCVNQKSFNQKAEFVLIELDTVIQKAGSSFLKTGGFGRVWAKTMEKADGLILVVPEYNHCFPGELKLFLDSAYPEYARKPVIAHGVSTGDYGGARAIEHLHAYLIALGMVVLGKSGMNAYFAHCDTLFDKKGLMNEKKYNSTLMRGTEELLWYAETLKSGKPV